MGVLPNTTHFLYIKAWCFILFTTLQLEWASAFSLFSYPAPRGQWKFHAGFPGFSPLGNSFIQSRHTRGSKPTPALYGRQRYKPSNYPRSVPRQHEVYEGTQAEPWTKGPKTINLARAGGGVHGLIMGSSIGGNPGSAILYGLAGAAVGAGHMERIVRQHARPAPPTQMQYSYGTTVNTGGSNLLFWVLSCTVVGVVIAGAGIAICCMSMSGKQAVSENTAFRF
eukprot:GHVN01020509.1.p1 GENE.GHVN01020509.1~~GHVN01020509.1.p1  ORF type:complete len:224 (-),score=4.61 GHVN01020509.1:215-886(-)